MPTRFSVEHDGRTIEVVPMTSLKRDRLQLYVDGELVDEAKPAQKVEVAGEGVTVAAKMAWHGTSVISADIVGADGERVPLAPEPGSVAARKQRFKEERPALYAARHAAAGVGKVVLPLLGIGLLLRFLPDFSIDLPLPSLEIDLPLPSIDLPSIPFPDITLPEWVRTVLNSAKYWGPILAGIVIAVREYRSRRKQPEPQRGG